MLCFSFTLVFFNPLYSPPGEWPYTAKRKRKTGKSSPQREGYCNKFKNCLYQFCLPTVYMSCGDGGVTLTEWGRVDKGLLERYLGNVELGYLPSEVVREKVTKSVSYKDLNDLNIWSRDGSSFQTGGIEDGDNPGSILDFEK